MRIRDAKSLLGCSGWLLLSLLGCGGDDASPSASGSSSSAGADAGMTSDAGASHDAAPPPPQVACAGAGSACPDDGVCAPDGFCIPRCDDQGACVVMVTPRSIASLAAEGATAYVGFATSYDSSGSARADGELHAVSDQGDRALVTGAAVVPTDLELVGDHAYYRLHRDMQDPRRQKLWRVGKTGAGAAEAIYPTAQAYCFLVHASRVAVKLADGIYLGSSDGQAALAKRLAANDSERDDPNLTSSSLCTLLALSDGALYWRKDPPRGMTDVPSKIASLDLSSGEQREHGDYSLANSPRVLGVEPRGVVYSQYLPGVVVVQRRDLLDPTVAEAALYRYMEQATTGSTGLYFALRGDWVYAALLTSRGDLPSQLGVVRVERASRTNVGTLEAVGSSTFPRYRGFGFSSFAASDTHLFFALSVSGGQSGPLGSVLYRRPMPSP